MKPARLVRGAVAGAADTARRFALEWRETRAMARVFFHLLSLRLNLENREDPPSKQEVREALEQLKDVGRVSVFASISLIPGGAFSLVALELAARSLGIKNFTLIPSSFRKRHPHPESEDSSE